MLGFPLGDVDPMSCAEANETVKAKVFYTEELNGLLYPWYEKCSGIRRGAGAASPRYLDHLPEKLRIRLGDPPVIRSRDHVGGRPEAAQDRARAGGLVPGDTDPQALIPEPGQRGPDIGI